MKKMLVTYEKAFTLEFEVEAESFGDAKDKADILINDMSNKEKFNKAQEGYWESVECEVVER